MPDREQYATAAADSDIKERSSWRANDHESGTSRSSFFVKKEGDRAAKVRQAQNVMSPEPMVTLWVAVLPVTQNTREAATMPALLECSHRSGNSERHCALPRPLSCDDN
jgi:hypothetical protein